MNNARIISVNPGIKTLGELNINEITLSRLSRTISSPGRRTSHFKNALNFIFGLNSQVNRQFSGKMLAVRIMTGSLMTVLGMTAVFGNSSLALPELMALATGIFGLSLLSGFFTRFISAAVAAVSAYFLYGSIMAGTPDMIALLVAVMAAGSSIMGPGFYSADMLLRRSLHRIYRNANRYDPERNAANLSYDYNAFASIDDRLN